MTDIVQPVQSGIPGSLGPTVVIATISTLPVTRAGELLALVVQLDALVYQIKIRLQKV